MSFSLYRLEILSIDCPNEYEKESWQLSDAERTAAIQEYREAGNELYRNGKIVEAEEKYRAAVAIIEQLLLKYVFWLEIWNEIESIHFFCIP